MAKHIVTAKQVAKPLGTGFLDRFGQPALLLTRQKGDIPHLTEVHFDRITVRKRIVGGVRKARVAVRVERVAARGGTIVSVRGVVIPVKVVHDYLVGVVIIVVGRVHERGFPACQIVVIRINIGRVLERFILLGSAEGTLFDRGHTVGGRLYRHEPTIGALFAIIVDPEIFALLLRCPLTALAPPIPRPLGGFFRPTLSSTASRRLLGLSLLLVSTFELSSFFQNRSS